MADQEELRRLLSGTAPIDIATAGPGGTPVPGQWPGWNVIGQRLAEMFPGLDQLRRQGFLAALRGQESTIGGWPSRIAEINLSTVNPGVRESAARIGEMQAGIQAMPEATRQILLRSPEKFTIMPDAWLKPLGRYLPDPGVIQYRPGTTDIAGTIAHEGVHAAGIGTTGKLGGLANRAADVPAGQGVMAALESVGYAPRVTKEELIPWLLTTTRGAQNFEAVPWLGRSLEGMLQNQPARAAILADLQALHGPASRAMGQTPMAVIRQRQAMRGMMPEGTPLPLPNPVPNPAVTSTAPWPPVADITGPMIGELRGLLP